MAMLASRRGRAPEPADLLPQHELQARAEPPAFVALPLAQSARTSTLQRWSRRIGSDRGPGGPRGAESNTDLAHRLVQAQEDERRRIARDLHDLVGQALAAVKLNLEAVQQRERRHDGEHSPPRGAGEDGRGSLDESIALVDGALRQVRDFALDLRPSALDDLGLVPALRSCLQRTASAGGLGAHFVADELPARLESDVETACFRVAQEALTNVVRHAHALRVGIELRRVSSRSRGPELLLTVWDDGRGFDGSRRPGNADGGSLGLLGMSERAALVGGRLDVRTLRGMGTRVQATFPLREIRLSAGVRA